MTTSTILGGEGYRWKGRGIRTSIQFKEACVMLPHKDSIIIAPYRAEPGVKYKVTIMASRSSGNGEILTNFYGGRQYDGEQIRIQILSNDFRTYTLTITAPNALANTQTYFRIWRSPQSTGNVYIKSVEVVMIESGQRPAAREPKLPVAVTKFTKHETAAADIPIIGNLVANNNILVIGVYYINKANVMDHIVQSLGSSKDWNVEQKWMALGDGYVSDTVASVTSIYSDKLEGRSININRLMKMVSWEKYRYIIICDDDVSLPDNFLDNYLKIVEKYDFALAQPSRTGGNISWEITKKIEGLVARKTRIVEGGPIISIRSDAAALMFPMHEESPMGWGEHLIWPYLLGQASLNIGIVDQISVEHNIRPVCSNYDASAAIKDMRNLLKKHKHLTDKQAMIVTARYK